MPEKRFLDLHDMPGRATTRIMSLAGPALTLLLLAGHVSACAFGEAGGEATGSRPLIPLAPSGQSKPQSTEAATRPQITAPPETYTPAPADPAQPTATTATKPAGTRTGDPGNPVLAIPLAGPVTDGRAELSGLAWYGDTLIILPQFPDFNGEANGGFVYALAKAEIVAYLDGQHDGPLEPRPVPFMAPGLAGRIAGFEGYEAVAFSGDEAYLTIEANNSGAMLGYLVRGSMAPDLTGLTLDTSTLAVVASQTGALNIAEESLFVADQLVGVIHELNGAKVNPAPVAHLFDRNLNPVGYYSFPNVPFRITDVSALDTAGRFWAINYFYPGSDEVLDVFGTPEGNSLDDQDWPAWTGLGRLLEFQITPTGIAPAGTAPIQLEVNLSDIHNWEGLARLDERGFLLVSDEIPGSVLGFVPFPEHVK